MNTKIAPAVRARKKVIASPAVAPKTPTPTMPEPKAATKGSAGKPDKKLAKPRLALVRDSFTMPQSDFALIATLKTTALGAQRAAKKSELLRAGLHLLAGLDAQSLAVVLDRLQTVKTGRPKKAS
jgi:hypothetical protein